MSHPNEEIAAGRRRAYRRVLLILAAASVIMLLFSVAVGRYAIPVGDVVKLLLSRISPRTPDWDPKAESILFTLRIPRALGAFLVGGALSLSGAAYQGVFKNPLVSPDLLGISSGSCVGAAAAILLGLSVWGVQVLAFAVGILAVLLTTLAPRILKNTSLTMLVLSGIVVSGIMNSLLGLLKYVADPETQLAAITYWQLGSMTKVMVPELLCGVPMLLAGAAVLILLRWKLNVLSLGENEAQMLGVNVRRMRALVILCATMLTAVSVSLCGTVGWVGLVIPHVSRMMVGDDNARSLPVSWLLGGLFLLIIDTLARTLTASEIPLSVLTGIVGAPFFYFVLAKQRMKLT
jgi:iron complex transport system permease protein